MLIPLIIDRQRFRQIYSKATDLMLNWSWIILTTNMKKNQDNISLGQPRVHVGIYTGLQESWHAGSQSNRSVSQCVCVFDGNNEIESASILLSCVFMGM